MADTIEQFLLDPRGQAYARDSVKNKFDQFVNKAETSMAEELTGSALSFADYTKMLKDATKSSINETSLENQRDFEVEKQLRKNIVLMVLLLEHNATPDIVNPLMQGYQPWLNVKQWDKSWVQTLRNFMFGRLFNKAFEVVL